MRAEGRVAIRALAACAALWTAAAAGHAFPEREEPGVGAVVHESPKQVRIWFDAKLEAPFSTVVVKEASGKVVSGASRVDPASLQRLETDLPPLAPGEYHVFWKVVAWDGHHTEGDYRFTVSR